MSTEIIVGGELIRKAYIEAYIRKYMPRDLLFQIWDTDRFPSPLVRAVDILVDENFFIPGLPLLPHQIETLGRMIWLIQTFRLQYPLKDAADKLPEQENTVPHWLGVGENVLKQTHFAEAKAQFDAGGEFGDWHSKWQEVDRALTELTEMGILHREARDIGDGMGYVYFITVNLDNMNPPLQVSAPALPSGDTPKP